MDELDIKDIELLFGKLVLLKEEGSEPDSENPTKAESTETTSAIKEKPERIVPKLCLLAPEELIPQLQSNESNFFKIIINLGISHVTEALASFDDSMLEGQEKISVNLWCIGLNEKLVAGLKERADKVLVTPNPEVEMSKEEKFALFNPIKEFAPNLK